MALGGDDGLVPGCIWRMYEIFKETGAELLTWSQAGFKYPMDENANGILSIPKKKFNGVMMLNSVDFLNKIAKSMNYLHVECPMFYIKGVASINLVNKVKSRTPDGCFYYCPTPDGFSGVVLAGEVEKYAYTREPLSIDGDTTKSQGRNYKRTDEKSKKESQQFFEDNARKTMHSELASQQYSPLVTLMTADYLLTARDLPGWPGNFEMFTWEHLIRKTFAMLVRNPFANEVLVRELRILREIAKQHNQLDLFNDLLKNTKRKLSNPYNIDGFFMTKNVFEFNATEMGIHNIYEASLAVNFAYQSCNMVNRRNLWSWIVRTIKVVRNSKKYKISYLPNID